VTNPEREGVDEIQTLTQRVTEISRGVDRWNGIMLWGLAFAAIAAIVVGISTRMVIVRTDQQAKAQDLLSAAKERALQRDLAQKQTNIASLNIAAETLKSKNLILSTRLVELQKQSEARRLTGAQRGELARLLKGVSGGGVAIVSPVADGEASDFADDLNSAIHDGAGWETVRIKNRITEKFGVSVVTAEGTPSSPALERLDGALTAVGIPHNLTTVKNGDASTDPAFQTGYLYLVIEHKPLPKKDRVNTSADTQE
jgi:hypothetical protein